MGNVPSGNSVDDSISGPFGNLVILTSQASLKLPGSYFRFGHKWALLGH